MMPFRLGCFFSILTLGLLNLTSYSLAQENSNSASTCEPNSKMFLWEAKSPNNTIYLMGSLHFLKAEDYPLNPRLEEAFDESEVIVFESNLDQALEVFLDPEIVNNYLILPEGTTLNTYLSPETYQLIQKKAESLDFPLEGLQAFKPWFVATMVTSLGLMELGFQLEQGIDVYFFTRAKRENKQMLALETAQEAIASFNNLPKPEEEQYLLLSFSELETLKNSMDTIVKAWKLGEVEQLESIFFEGLEKFPTLQDRLMVQRNQKWVTKIKPFFNQNEDYLIIVGSAHLVGEDSLIELLEKEGYSFKQVSCL